MKLFVKLLIIISYHIKLLKGDTNEMHYLTFFEI
jgi:hypothetical protein